MDSPWRAEAYWVALLAFVGLFVGKVTGLYLAGFGLSVLAYLARQLFHINRIALWLRAGGKIPQGSGIWEEIYYLIYRLRRRNKNRKKRLLEMLERFRTATSALPDATVVLGPRAEIDWFNTAAERLLGLRKGDVGQQIGNLLRSPKFAEFLRASDSQATLNIASPMADKGQLEIRIVPYGEDLRLLIAQDVTQLRFMERVRSDFVSNVSHELRTPLTVLRGYVETLGDAGEDLPEHYQKIFRRMEEQTLRMQKLIDGLLALTKLESGAMPQQTQKVDVAALLRNICDESHLLARQGQTLALRLESSARLAGSEAELRSAFSNLIVNALKYAPEDGKVDVCWRDEPGGGGVVEVLDNGPGIAAEHLPRLTERFYRVETGKSAGQSGVGLGLAIVKHVLTRHEGELRIASALGKGSCFSCHFSEKRLLREDG
ncbi:MAG: phosphate regulon sensor histidine kinase PhoR [Candidatus Methylumidiphilus sp.]